MVTCARLAWWARVSENEDMCAGYENGDEGNAMRDVKDRAFVRTRRMRWRA